MSILPVDQGIEHSAGASFAPNPAYFDPENIIDVATFEDPNRVSKGVQYVFVNGVLGLDGGKLTAKLGGRPLRGPGNQQGVTRSAEKPRGTRNLSHPKKSSVQSHH